MASFNDTTRKYVTPGQVITTSGTSSRTASPIMALEVLVHASTSRCFIAVGDSTVAATSSGIPIEAGEKFHLQLNVGQYIAAIQDSAAGSLSVIPVQL